MKKTTKVLGLLMTLTLAMLVFAGCGTNSDEQKAPNLTVIEAVDSYTWQCTK